MVLPGARGTLGLACCSSLVSSAIVSVSGSRLRLIDLKAFAIRICSTLLRS
jgi:hypothetical protein